MKKLLFIVAFTPFVNFASVADATAAVTVAPTAVQVEAAEAADDAPPAWLLIGAGFDLFSAYVWRHSVANDELVFQPCVWFDITRFKPFYFGGNVWQNWDMTGSRSGAAPKAMNETDFNLHVGSSLWTSDDEAFALSLELGVDFYTYRQMEGCHDSYEFYAKTVFENPFVNVYGLYAQAYHPVSACYFELGLNKEATLAELFESENDILDRLTVGADWSIGFASGKYASNYLYGVIPYGAYDEDAGDYEGWQSVSDGVGGTTLKANLAYKVCEHFSVGLVLAYTAVLSGDARDSLEYAGCNSHYKELVWGGLQAKLEF